MEREINALLRAGRRKTADRVFCRKLPHTPSYAFVGKSCVKIDPWQITDQVHSSEVSVGLRKGFPFGWQVRLLPTTPIP